MSLKVRALRAKWPGLVACVALAASALASLPASSLAAQIVELTTYAQGLSSSAHPEQVITGPDGNIWFVDQGSPPAIGELNVTTGQITEYPFPLSTAVPADLTFGPSGQHIWVTDQGTPAIWKFDPTAPSGSQFTQYTAGLQASGSYPQDIVSSGGDLWFVDAGAVLQAIGRVDPTNGHITEYGQQIQFNPAPVAPAASLAASQSVTLTVTDQTSAGGSAHAVANQPLYVSIASSTGTAAAGTAAVGGTPLTSTPTTFTTDANGQVTITYTAPATLPASGADVITAQNAATNPTRVGSVSYSFASTAATFEGMPVMGQIQGMVAGSDGNIWFGNTTPCVIPNTNFNGQTCPSSTAGMFNAVAALNPATGLITDYTTGLQAPNTGENNFPGAGSLPQWLTVSGGDVWFADFGNANEIGGIDVSTGQITEYPVNASFGYTGGLATGAGGTLWFLANGGLGPVLGTFDTTTGQSATYGLPSNVTRGLTYGPGSAPWFVNHDTSNTISIAKATVVATAPDGSGTLTESPGVVTSGATGANLTFTYTASGPVSNGTIALEIPAGWTLPQTSNASAPGYVTASKGLMLPPSGSNITISQVDLQAGQTLTINYSDATAPTTPGSSTFIAGEESTSSGSLTSLAAFPGVTVSSVAPPGQATGVSASGGTGQATLSWTAPASDGGSPITDYVIGVTPQGGSPGTVDTHSTGTTFTVTGLTNGVGYTFTVAAVNGVGTGTASTPTSQVVPELPRPPVPAALEVVSATLPAGQVGKPYLGQMQAQGGVQPYTWSVPAGTAFCPGLSVSKDGDVSGTPTTSGTCTTNVTVTDGRGVTVTASVSVHLQSAAIAIQTSTLPNIRTGVPKTVVLVVQGGLPPYTWSVTQGALPPGVTLSADGVLSGTATKPGTYSFTLTVSDATGARASTHESWVVARASVVVKTRTLMMGAVGEPYDVGFDASGGDGQYEWSVAGGLPAGLALSSRNGEVHGTPTQAGTYRLRVSVVDRTNHRERASAVLQLQVVARPQVVVLPPPAPVVVKRDTSAIIRFALTNESSRSQTVRLTMVRLESEQGTAYGAVRFGQGALTRLTGSAQGQYSIRCTVGPRTAPGLYQGYAIIGEAGVPPIRIPVRVQVT